MKVRRWKIEKLVFTNFIGGSLIIFMVILVSGFSSRSESLKEDNESLTVANLKIELELLDVAHPEIVLAQAIHETGWFKCDECSLDRNNIFGFYYKKQYLKFETWKACVAYYKRWQDRHYDGGDYFEFLEDVGFATDPHYVARLKTLIEHY